MSDLDGLPALAELYDEYARPLHGYLSKRVGPDVADDLVAETFLLLWQNRERYDPSRASPRAWLYGMASNVLRGHVRTEVRRLRAWTRHGAREVPGIDLSSRVVDIADAATLAGKLAAAVAKLRVEERDVLLMVAWGDLAPVEIAEVLDVPVGTVRSWLHRARSRLRGLVDTEETMDDQEVERHASR
ncbi:RNA polymerase sigma-70 factor (ECF subfamily) [Kibdelosporangium banguiense]|uniref:RNA polymerase sigma-70 factor (ECF subfamily) n=1 Tax=Kibdelosporangium banguiense TaxID=1365924 RepID=A0ABS4TG02_9PSEU|nr:sigma-70 family RNA polymerase sigma factor [Kibdelosporangium banguiense]MBP2322793.1 RNA polymerase sigma-70 factor (ECF subfamily) [Kibdelosporangium banguiense]